MTPRPTRCANSCNKEPASGLKCCSGCKKEWYCSKACQKEDWRRHIFDCERKGPIGTAYYLSRACSEKLLPVHDQTRKDFGFEKAEILLCECSQGALLALWTRVFRAPGVTEKDVQKWQIEGTLLDGIWVTFARRPPESEKQLFTWFLQNQNLFDGLPLDETQVDALAEPAHDDASIETWLKAGGSPADSVPDIGTKFKPLPEYIQDCHDFYALLSTSRSHPGPEYASWLTFGFVAAMNQEDEQRISRGYLELVNHCAFDVFSLVYGISSIPRLADSHKVLMTGGATTSADVFFRDVMSESPRRFKTVWHLKHYVDQLRNPTFSEPRVKPSRAMRADYGFSNCQNSAEEKLLDELYMTYFALRDANPLELHEACIRGALAQYLGGFVRLKPKPKTYRRLLKNAYPSRSVLEAPTPSANHEMALVRVRRR